VRPVAGAIAVDTLVEIPNIALPDIVHRDAVAVCRAPAPHPMAWCVEMIALAGKEANQSRD
jgi:hypothetical protein